MSEEEYAQQVEYVRLFLAGKDDQVLTQLIARMEKASQALEFEEAARIRDQIQAVRRVTEKQFVSNTGDDLDVIGVAFDAGMACVHVLFIRQGKVLGSRSYFPKVPGGTELGEVVETFVGQFYLQGSQMRTLPGEILLDFNLGDKTLLADSLSELAGRRVNVQTKPRGDRARYLKLARTNAATALTTKLSQQSTIHQRLQALATVLKLPAVKRMECFDISHTMGEQTVASCVVFDSNGPLRAEYRRYNITGITPGDDYAAMNQVLRRRYGKAIEENKIPDVILIDGGKGQLGQAKSVFAGLDVPGINSILSYWGWQKVAIVKPGWKRYSSNQKAKGLTCRLIRLRCTLFSTFAMNPTIMPLPGIVKKTGKSEKHQFTGDYRRGRAETPPDAAEVYGRIARVTASQRRGDSQSTGYISRSGRKDLLLVETLGAL